MALLAAVLRTGLVRTSLVVAQRAAQKLEGLGLGQLRRIHGRPGRGLVLGGGVISAAVTKEGIRAEEVSSYDWVGNRPTLDAFAKFYHEIDEAHQLTLETLTCNLCGLRLRIDGELPDVAYCECADSPKSVFGVEGRAGWRPFMERKDILVWRRPHATLQGMYEYKMYGSFKDVTAEEFLFVQNDLSKFRVSWDASTKQVRSIENCEEESSTVYYWEVNWPRFFSNRDYCCHRTVQTEAESGTVACVSVSTHHPACAETKGVVRVSDYFSVLSVRAHHPEGPTRPGTEFCLTGFENPGVSLPEAIITWVAVRGMPEFMMNLREACLRLRREREGGSWGRQEENFGQLYPRRQLAAAAS